MLLSVDLPDTFGNSKALPLNRACLCAYIKFQFLNSESSVVNLFLCYRKIGLEFFICSIKNFNRTLQAFGLGIGYGKVFPVFFNFSLKFFYGEASILNLFFKIINNIGFCNLLKKCK